MKRSSLTLMIIFLITQLFGYVPRSEQKAVQSISPENKMVIYFKGVVKKIELLDKNDKKIILIGADPKWTLTVRIDSAAGETLPFKVGETAAFGIHSPTKLFAESDKNAMIGKSYTFELSCEHSLEKGWAFIYLKVK